MPQVDAKASVALVTGATGGIGKEIARQLGAAGWSVLVGARDSARGAKAVAEVGGQLLLLDVTDAVPAWWSWVGAAGLDARGSHQWPPAGGTWGTGVCSAPATSVAHVPDSQG
jgi:NAD(P)-dependent dehydrogenase (short-subunit alcohol dehydrogenase family)